jgi:DNA (cytosine-5)-methyltransferase 1
MRNDGGAGDERNGLVLIYLHFIEEFRPRFVLFENVAGIRERHGRAIYEQFCNGLRQLDYAVTEKLHDAADFGVPQHRERVLVVAGRDLEEPPFPTLTHADPFSEEVQMDQKDDGRRSGTPSTGCQLLLPMRTVSNCNRRMERFFIFQTTSLRNRRCSSRFLAPSAA